MRGYDLILGLFPPTKTTTYMLLSSSTNTTYLLHPKGAEIIPGKGSHHKVTLNGKSTVFPDHGAREIGTGLVEKIKRDLGLK
jgi:mRNA interferase HicA